MTWASSKRLSNARPSSLEPAAPEGSEVQQYAENDVVDGRNFLLMAAETMQSQRKLHRSVGIRYFVRVGTGRTLFYFSRKVRESGIINHFVSVCPKDDRCIGVVSFPSSGVLEVRTMDFSGNAADSDFYVMMNGITRAGLNAADGAT
jgi:hypothetical protein